MLSFNHYAYGACIDWVYRHVAGIAPDLKAPGYRHVVFAPRPATGIDRASASVDTPYGEASIAWRLAGDTFTADIGLPFGTHATFRPPATAGSVVVVDGEERVGGPGDVRLEPGRHSISVTSCRVYGRSAVPLEGGVPVRA